MKAIRSIAFILCIVLVSAFLPRADAAGDEDGDVLSQYASELSQYTGLKYYKGDNTQRYIDYKSFCPEETWENVITYVNIGLDVLFYTNPGVVVNPGDTWVLINKYRPLPQDFIPMRLEPVGKQFAYGTQKLTHVARLAFEKLCTAAKASGYPIWATSSYRSYNKQAEVYADFYNPDDPSPTATQEQLAARPGFSEHQTGLAVDISRVDATVKSAAVNKWLATNAYKYGFILRYPAGKEGVTGYTNEPWHLRYLGVKLATAVYKSKLTYDEYYMRELDIPPACADTRAVGITALTAVTVLTPPLSGDAAVLNAAQVATYDVLGARYFRLRDIAVLLSGSQAQFDIAWDAAAGRISLRPGEVYTGDPTLASVEPGRAILVTAVTPGLLAGDSSVQLPAYLSAGANCFKLEDILGLLGATVSDDGQGGLIIDTAAPASAEPSPPAETLPVV
jgi:D-alanyl-D-alanine carboxypeptidase